MSEFRTELSGNEAQLGGVGEADVSRLDRGEQLVLGLDSAEFWQSRTLDELARLQGAGRPIDPEELYDADATDEERDAFMAAIAVLD